MSEFTVSDRVDSVPPSGIRRFFELAEERDDVVSLGVGEPDFSAPWRAREAAVAALERGRTSYTANRGTRELREEIARYVERFDLSYDPDDEILVTAGASEAIDLAFRALCNPGDGVAIAQPAYVSYVPGVQFADARPIPVPTRAEDGFRLTPRSCGRPVRPTPRCSCSVTRTTRRGRRWTATGWRRSRRLPASTT